LPARTASVRSGSSPYAPGDLGAATGGAPAGGLLSSATGSARQCTYDRRERETCGLREPASTKIIARARRAGIPQMRGFDRMSPARIRSGG